MRARNAVLLVSLLGCACNHKSAEQQRPPDPAKITQFYAYPNPLPAGEKELRLCYGVEDAVTVELDPQVDRMWPSIARCLQIEPVRKTYTLTAHGKAGDTVTKKVEVTFGPPRLEFLDVSINKTRVSAGEQVSFCFKAKNATSISGGPGTFLRGGNPQQDCLIDHPTHGTTYVMEAKGPGGQLDSRTIEVDVR